MPTIYWTVFVRQPDMTRAMRVSSDGTLVNRRVHAALIPSRETAERYAEQINNAPDGDVAWARAF